MGKQSKGSSKGVASLSNKKLKKNDSKLQSSQPRNNNTVLPTLNSITKLNCKNIQVLHPGAVHIYPNFFSRDECYKFVSAADRIGFEHLSQPGTRMMAQRECGRIHIQDASIALSLFERMKSLLETIQLVPNKKMLGCNDAIRLYKYDKGMSFGRHYDGSNDVKYLDGVTEITVLVYLTSCDGGATRFYPPKSSKKGSGSGFACSPQEGTILWHVHGDRCLEHEADPVIQGVKYVLRTDVVYER